MSKQQVRARLLDALVSEIILPPLPAGTNFLDEEEMFQHNAALRQIVTDATCIEATNVARFFDSSYLGDGSFDSWSSPTRTTAITFRGCEGRTTSARSRSPRTARCSTSG